MDVAAEVDGLYRLPMADFIAARNALAAQLRKAGLANETARVKALARPSAAAWAANQVYWNARVAFDQLVEAVGRLREALAAGIPAQEARRAMQARSDALAAAMREAERALSAAGHAASPAVLGRVQANLEALATGTSSAAPGRLAEDLDPPGLDAHAGLPILDAPRRPLEQQTAADPGDVAGQGSPTEADIEARRRQAEAATAAHAESVRRLEAARFEAEEARRALERAEARLREAEVAEAKARALLPPS